MLRDVLNWLVDQGLLRDVLAFLIGVGCARLLGFGQVVRAHLWQQARIADRLDTHTPGGLADILAAYQEAQLDPGPGEGR